MTKAELIGRLFKEGHITFDEALLLAEGKTVIHNINVPSPLPNPLPSPWPFDPWRTPIDPYWNQPYRVTC